MDKQLIRFLILHPSTWLATLQVILAKLLKRDTVTVSRQGLRILTGTGSGEGLFCAVAGTKYESEMEWFLDQMKPGATFVDVGANIGIYSLHASRRLGISGRIHAFEPTQETFKILSTNIRVNRLGNIQTNKLALADKIGTLYLVAEGRPASNSTSINTPCASSAISIEATTLDEYRKSQLGMKVDFIKVDIEGGERAFFEGARKTLLEDKPLILFESMHTGPEFPEREVLRELGYKMHILDSGTLMEIDPESLHGANLIAIKYACQAF